MSGEPLEIHLKTKKEFHLLRKVWHILGVLFLFTFLYFTGLERAQQIIGLLVFMGLVLAFELVRLNNKKFNRFFFKFLKPFMRKNELNGFSGVFPLMLGVLVVLVVFPPLIAQMSILFLAFGDPVASFIGLLYGKTKVFREKTLEGFIGCWLCCCFLVASFWPQIYFDKMLSLSLFAISAGFIGAVSELLDLVGVNDNFTIPVFSACGLWALSYGTSLV